ncbi:unnamed protein product [Ectocarpus sp. 8 AP-2014]
MQGQPGSNLQRSSREWRRLQPSWRPIHVQAGTSAGRERGRQCLTLLWERGTTATPPTHASAQT